MDVSSVNFGDLAAVAAILLPIVWKVIDFVKFLRAGDMNAVTTQGVVWVVGTLLTFLFAQTTFAGGFNFGGETLATLNWASLLFIGIAMGAGTSIGYDLKKAIDNNDSAAVPALIPSGVKVVDSTTGQTTTEAVGVSNLAAPAHLRDGDVSGNDGYKTTDLP